MVDNIPTTFYSYIPVLPAVLLALTYFIETIGYSVRYSGCRFGLASLGYSLHVQIATLARCFNFIALPVMGWMIDTGCTTSQILSTPLTFGLLFTVMSAFYLKYNNNEQFVDKVFLFFAKYISRVNVDTELIHSKSHEVLPDIDKQQIVLYGVLSSFFSVGGFFIPFVLAINFTEYRATLLQLSPFFTAIGTMVSVIYFDPRVSMALDNSVESVSLMKSIIVSRSLALLFISLISFVYILWI